MSWPFPQYFWIETIPLVLLSGWALAEIRQHRRLRKFGDPKVLGMDHPWLPRVAAALLLSLGLAAAGAVMPAPGNDMGPVDATPAAFDLVLDLPQSAEPGDALESLLQTIIDQIPGAHFSLLVSGPPIERLVPVTEDTMGLMILLDAQLDRLAGQSNPDRSETLIALQERIAGEDGRSRFVVVTDLPVGELERLPVRRPQEFSRLLFVSFGGKSETSYVGRRSAEGMWTWLPAPGGIGDLLAQAQDPGPQSPHWSRMQQWALLAMLLLCGEYVCRLAAQAKAKRGPLA